MVTKLELAHLFLEVVGWGAVLLLCEFADPVDTIGIGELEAAAEPASTVLEAAGITAEDEPAEEGPAEEDSVEDDPAEEGPV